MELCGVLERQTGGLVSRQLGASTRGRRILDILTISTGPEFDARTEITSQTIPELAIAADVGPGRARYWKDCFECHPDRARVAVDRAVEIGFFERERRNGRTYIRQTVRYPDWFGTLRAIENKPDLDRPGELSRQLRTDVSLGVCDEVVLATASYVTGAHLNRIPDEVGVWRFDPDSNNREVIREPERLPAGPGIELLDQQPARTDISVVSAPEIARLRRQLAERAYGKGWRVAVPACPHVEYNGNIPYCTDQQRVVHPADDCACPPTDATTVDLDAIRDQRSPWVKNPSGTTTTQTRLDNF